MNARDVIAAAAGDRTQGAGTVALYAAEGLARLASERPSPGEFAPAFLQAARTLIVNQTPMGSVWRLVNDCLVAADAAEGPEFAADAVIDAAKAFRLRSARAQKKITHELAQLIPEGSTIVTTSASSTLERAFIALGDAGRIANLYCTVSEPGGEGKSMAERLRDKQIRAHVIPDSAVAYAVDESDFVLFGADAVCSDWSVNKVGTLPLALCGTHTGVRGLVVAESTKMVPSAISQAIGARLDTDPQVARFETVPWRLLEGWVCEDGLVPSRNVDVQSELIDLHERVLDLCADLTESLRVPSGDTDPGVIDAATMERALEAAEDDPLDILLEDDLEGGLLP